MNAPFDAKRAAASGVEAYLDVRYDERRRPYTRYPFELTRYLTRRFLDPHRGGRLLDLGSGRGEFLHGFSELGFSAVGIDRSRPARERFSESVTVADYERAALPFADAHFDVVFNKSVLEHVVDVSRVLSECYRVLAPGGRLITLVPDWRAQWRHFYDDWTHVRPFTLVGLQECIQSHGFRVVEASRFRQLPFLWQRPYLKPLCDVAALLPERLKQARSRRIATFVRFSKEWMLLVVADRVQASAANRGET